MPCLLSKWHNALTTASWRKLLWLHPSSKQHYCVDLSCPIPALTVWSSTLLLLYQLAVIIDWWCLRLHTSHVAYLTLQNLAQCLKPRQMYCLPNCINLSLQAATELSEQSSGQRLASSQYAQVWGMLLQCSCKGHIAFLGLLLLKDAGMENDYLLFVGMSFWVVPCMVSWCDLSLNCGSIYRNSVYLAFIAGVWMACLEWAAVVPGRAGSYVSLCSPKEYRLQICIPHVLYSSLNPAMSDDHLTWLRVRFNKVHIDYNVFTSEAVLEPLLQHHNYCHSQ